MTSHDDTDHDPAAGPASAPLTVVGIGASAGGLGALKRFFAPVSSDSGLAYVIVVHLAPEQESHLADLLQPHVAMPVLQVTETTPLEANRVYVIPPNANLSAIDTHLRLSSLESRRRERAPIDHFFRTLATTHDGHAIGVVLTGTGSDGTLGLKEIKEHSGLTVVQDPGEAEYDGMPQSAISTGLVDLILPLAEIPAAIERFAAIEPRIPLPDDEDPAQERQDGLLQKIFAHIRARTGRDFSRYKRSTILRRVQRRMQLCYAEEVERYLNILRERPDEVQALADDLLITVTSFFRDEDVYAELERDVVPQLFRSGEANGDIRVWSVGCATGEEAYSIAMLIVEHAERAGLPMPAVQIFASDLHEQSLARAREGFFAGDITAEVSAERLQRFFTRENGGYRIAKELREMVVFAPHSLLADPPFSRLDLVLCRNLLIYLKRDVQAEIVDVFHYALRGEGFLVLGSAETVDSSELFRTVSKDLCIYRRRDVPGPEPRLPVFPSTRSGLREERAAAPPQGPPNHGELHQRLVEQYGPPSILIGPDQKIVHLSQHAGRYLVVPGGDMTASAPKLAREELRIELRAALHAAQHGQRAVSSNPVMVRFNGEVSPVVVHVRPALEPQHEGYVLVTFEERGPADTDAGERPAVPGGGTEAELRAELDLVKQRLQSIIEEYETSQEEMKASNEELQSANEELRSTMEELETSKEELQSVNEELHTVNQENRYKVEELGQLSSDLQNLLAATDIATLFLDKKTRILRFTPRVSELFNIRTTDRGRPISDLTHRLGYVDLADDIRQVVLRLVPIERELQDDSGRWYITRIMPYRSTEDRIEGTVITFIEITARKRIEEALRESEQRYRLLVENAREYAIFVLDLEGRISTWNTGAERIFGYRDDEAIGLSIDALFTEEDRAAGVPETEMRIARDTGQSSDDRWHVRRDGSRFWVSGSIEAVRGEDGELLGFAKVLRDNTERKEAEQALVEAKANLEERVAERTAQVRALAGSLTRAEQRERRRLSSVLHDDLQQQLYGIQLRLRLTRKALDDGQVAEADGALQAAEEALERSTTLTRQLSVDLNPPVLRNEGLVAMAEWLRAQMADLHGLDVVMETSGEVFVQDGDERVLLFQIIRELLFNVVKHAGTDQARLRIEATDAGLVITVADQGHGFDAAALDADSEAFGLTNIQERLELIGGQMQLDAAPGQGTRVKLQLHGVRHPESD